MTEPIRLALVGCGGISKAHVAGYEDLYGRGCREFQVTACCDVIEESARQRAHEIAQFQDQELNILLQTVLQLR